MESNYDAKDLYEVEEMNLEETKKSLTDVSVHLNTKRKIHMGFKIGMI